VLIMSWWAPGDAAGRAHAGPRLVDVERHCIRGKRLGGHAAGLQPLLS